MKKVKFLWKMKKLGGTKAPKTKNFETIDKRFCFPNICKVRYK